MLRYDAGQRYDEHHDYIEQQAQTTYGSRILTVFLYLSDVEAGGHTAFPRLEPPLSVAPRKGSVLLWPSTLDDLVTKEPATLHAAMPVERGVKHAANVWIHRGNYRKANHMGCTGSFA